MMAKLRELEIKASRELIMLLKMNSQRSMKLSKICRTESKMQENKRRARKISDYRVINIILIYMCKLTLIISLVQVAVVVVYLFHIVAVCH